jgi:hypothetical protein
MKLLCITLFAVLLLAPASAMASMTAAYPNPVVFGFDAYANPSTANLIVEVGVVPATPMGMPDTTVSFSTCEGWGDVYRMTGKANRHLDLRKESLTRDTTGKAELLVWHINTSDSIFPLGLRFQMAPRANYFDGKGGPATCIHIDVRVDGSQEHISYDRTIDLG